MGSCGHFLLHTSSQLTLPPKYTKDRSPPNSELVRWKLPLGPRAGPMMSQLSLSQSSASKPVFLNLILIVVPLKRLFRHFFPKYPDPVKC